MPSLIQLPTELRHQILLLVLPSTNHVESPTPTHYLSHINRRLRNDMITINAFWTPTQYISSPSSLTSRYPPTRGCNLTRICLDLFSTSFLGRILWRFHTQNPTNYTHPELLAAWTDAVPFLSTQVREVALDVTPAPAETRQLRAALDEFVTADYAARRFLRGHIEDVAMLVARIEQHYGGRVQVRLTGRLSTKSAFFVRAVGRKVGREVEYMGQWVSIEEARCARLGAAVARETLCPLVRQGGRCKTHRLGWVSGVIWSGKTGMVYERVAGEGLGLAVVQDVKKIAGFRDGGGGGSESVLVFAPAQKSRRAFQHRVAADLGLRTIEAGGETCRHVVVRC